MCEIFGLSSAAPVETTGWQRAVFAHGDEHPDGWGLAWRDGEEEPFLRKGPERSLDSAELASILSEPISHTHLLAHIRQASQGGLKPENCHPFAEHDVFGRTWVMAHNGAVMNDDLLPGYDIRSEGETDSEWVVLFLLDVLEEASERAGHPLGFEERFDALASAIAMLSAGNMLNLVIDDGTYLYAHTNTVSCSLRWLRLDGTVVVSTEALDDGDWQPMPVCRLVAFRDGEMVGMGPRHVNCSWSGRTLADYLSVAGPEPTHASDRPEAEHALATGAATEGGRV